MNLFTGFIRFKMLMLVLASVLISCGNTKKAAVPCPDFSNKRSYRSHHSTGRPDKAYFAQRHASIKGLQRKYAAKPETMAETRLSLQTANSADADKWVFLNSLTASLNPMAADINLPMSSEHVLVQKDSITIACDTIIFKQGNKIIGKVLEIGLNEIRYRECEQTEGEIISISKADVFVIKHPDGTKDYFYSENPMASQMLQSPTYKVTEGFSLTSFFMAIGGFFIFGIPLGLGAIVFGSIGLAKIKRHPDKYRGKGFAITGIIVGLIDVVGMIIILANMY